jgi:hypothetical protein
VRSRVEREVLHRIHPGVYCLHPPPFSRRQLYLAAVYAGGPETALSDLAAAGHLGLLEHLPLPAHITNRSGRGRGLPGVVAHRRTLGRHDHLIVDGIPCTTATRTVLDCAAAMGIRELEDLLLAADSLGKLNRRRLEELLDERSGQPGVARLRELITDDPADTRSKNERRMLRICRRHGVPVPLTNHPVEAGGRTYLADFCWPELRLIVEADSWRWHGGRLKAEEDRDRDQRLAIAGWRVIHFTRNQIRHEPAEVGRRLLALTRSLAGSSPGGRW